MDRRMLPPLDQAVAWRDVSKSYPDGFTALRGVTLGVAEGEVLAVLGTSGSGKTTLLKMVNRLIDPTAGEVVVLGTPTARWDPIRLRRSIGYVIQDVGLLPHLSIRANVGIVPRLVGLDPAEHALRRPRELSGGQRQRVGFARALAADPALILMDEPFGALDPITRRELQDEFRALQKRLGKTVVLVTHDIREACRIADKLALMDRGRLVQWGTAEELRSRPSSPFVRAFFREAEAVGPAVAEGGS